MEELTKGQLVLLALLVSFVTSIATGIATATLVDQAPPRVEQVINRVVERTVETVVPSESPSVVTREETIVVKEEDLITQTVGNTSASLVRLYSNDDQAPVFLSLGFGISEEGLVVAPSRGFNEGVVYSATLPNGKSQNVRARKADVARGFVFLEPELSEGQESVDLATLKIGDTSALQLGQGVFAVSGRENTTVAEGIISRLDTESVPVEGGEPVSKLSNIQTNIAEGELVPGTPLVNIFGEVVGFYGPSTGGGFIPASKIGEGLSELAG